MNKAFYKLANRLTLYYSCDNFQTSSNKLRLAHSALDPMEDVYIHVAHDAPDKPILIWSSDSFKERANIQFKTLQEEEAFENAYQTYFDKRWEDLPKIKISKKDYDALVLKWEKIKYEKPEYVIFILDDSGHLDKINVIGKNELSSQDLQDMHYEHVQYLKWKEACFKYATNHPDYSETWRSSADDEYEADIEKHY